MSAQIGIPHSMRKKIKVTASNTMAAIIASVIAYYVLLCDNPFHTSIASVINYADAQAMMKHMLILSFLPIYIALIVFGSAIIGLYLGSGLQTFFFKFYAPHH